MSFLIRRVVLTLVSLLAAAFALQPAQAEQPKGRYVLISHAPDSDSWWNTVKTAVREAGEDYGVTVDYRNPPNGDLADMSRLVEQAAARGYDGVVATIADFQVLKGSLGKVTNKKIPLVTINSGTTAESESLGALMHVGQPEYEAGKAAGERARADGIKSFACVNHYATNPASFERCRGFADAIGADVGKSTIDTGGVDPTAIKSKVAAYLRRHPDTQAVLTLGPDGALPTLEALEAAGLRGKLWFATFDLSDDIRKAVQDGSIRFAIDQQPYLQGYMPIAVLATMRALGTTDVQRIEAAIKANPKTAARLSAYGLTPLYGPRHIGSGPSFVTRDNLAKSGGPTGRSN